MFCINCSAEVLSSAANYCYSCGKMLTGDGRQTNNNHENKKESVGQPNDKQSKKSTPRARALSYEDFRKRKAEDRSSKFKSKTGKQPKVEREEKINIGIMVWNTDSCVLSTKRGSILPLLVDPDIDAETLKKKAVEKQHRFHSGIVKSDNPFGYRLLFPDKQLVEDKLPWQNTQFTLRSYKDELGKPYSRITLYLCTSLDYLSHLGTSSSDSDESDMDGKQNDDCSSTTTNVKVHKLTFNAPINVKPKGEGRGGVGQGWGF